MGKHDDKLTPGYRINRLTFIDHGTPTPRAGGRNRATVRLRCECGEIVEKDRYAWLAGRQISCGCYGRETRHLRHRTHGMTGTPIHSSWLAMKARTTPGTAAHSGNYVGVGRDPRWDTFEGFLANQPAGRSFRPGLHLARNGDLGDYTPENCRWATPSENADEMLERRKVRLPDGRFACDVAKENGVPESTWQQRYYVMGIPIEEAVTVRNMRQART